MMSVTINNNPLIEAYNLIEKVIRENVIDVNETRRILPTSREKQWIFPTTPEELTNYYPRVAIVLTGVSYTEHGSAQFGEYVTEPISGYVSEVTLNYAILSLTIGIFTKKKEEFQITLPGKTTAQICKGVLLNTYLTGKIEKALHTKRDDMIQDNAVDVVINRITPTYEDSEQLFASNISITVTMPNTWGIEYETGELIAEINKFYNVDEEEKGD